MFIDIRNLQERRQERDSQFEGTRDIRNGYLFEVNGSIEGDRDGLVWFKARDGNSEPFQVFYNGVIGDIRANMPVKIERNPKEPARWRITEFNTGIYFDDQSSYEQLPSLSMIPKKEDYEWPPGFPGAKALNIFPRAITDFAVRPTSPTSMKARVYSGIYPGATNYARFQGPVNTKDFTADIPGTAGLARLAAISIDYTGTLNYTNGSTFVDGLPMPDASLPDVPASEMLISAVRLVNGMTAIEESNFDLEMRPLMANGTVNVKVSEIWESDFDAVALQADATGQIGIGVAAPNLLLQVGNDAANPPQNPAFDGIFVAASISGAQVAVLDITNKVETVLASLNTGLVGTSTNDDLALISNNLTRATLTAVGDFGIGTTGPDARLDVLDTAGAQLRLTFEDGVKFADFTLDTNHDLTIDPSSTGLIKLAADVTITNLVSHEGDLDTELAFTDDDVEITVGALSMLKLTEAAQDLITLGPGSGDVDINFNGDMFLQGSDGFFGIGETSPTGITHVKWASSADAPRLEFTGAGNLPATYIFFHNSASPANDDGLGEFRFNGNNDAGVPEEIVFSRVSGFSPTITDGLEDGELRFTTMVGGTSRSVGRWIAGDLGIGNNVTPAAKLHVDQFSTTAAIPTLYLDQADISEEMIEFNTTIGVGNAIEAVGAKTLTTTHFIKVTLPGALTRYIPVGTIA